VDTVNSNSQNLLDTFKIKEEPADSDESCDQQITNNDTNLQDVELEPQFCITDGDDFVGATYDPDINIKVEPEDTAADFTEPYSNTDLVPFASITINNDLIIKSEPEWIDAEKTKDNESNIHGK
jgi:hypothetical protein